METRIYADERGSKRNLIYVILSEGGFATESKDLWVKCSFEPKGGKKVLSEKMTAKPQKFCYDYPRPMVTVDVAVLYPGETGPEILLIQRKNEPFAGKWALPGGFVEMDEDLEPAVRRELREETSLEGLVLEQMAAFGQPGRDPRGRTISIVYVARCTPEQAEKARPGDDAAAVRWFALDQLPELAFDHAEIINKVLKFRIL